MSADGSPSPSRAGGVAPVAAPATVTSTTTAATETVHNPYAVLHRGQSRRVDGVPPDWLARKTEAPPYEDLINFPRAKDKDEIRCVMCGLPPGQSCVIPRQNKDVCKECDKSTWQHVASNVYFKWCKGCKKFLRLGSFSEKLDAAKCDRCRERGRQSYLLKKGKDNASSSPGTLSSASTSVMSSLPHSALSSARSSRGPRSRSASMTAMTERDLLADVEMTAAAAAAVVAVSRGIRGGGPGTVLRESATVSLSSSGEDDEREPAELSDCEEEDALHPNGVRLMRRRSRSESPVYGQHHSFMEDSEDVLMIDDDKADVTTSKLSSVFGVPLRNLATRRRRSLSCTGVDGLALAAAASSPLPCSSAAAAQGPMRTPTGEHGLMVVDQDASTPSVGGAEVTPVPDKPHSMRHRLNGTLYELACIHQRIVTLEEKAARVTMLEDEIRDQEGEMEALRAASTRLKEELIMSKLQQDMSRREADKLREECSRLNEQQQQFEKREAELTRRLSEADALEALASCVMERVHKRPRLVSLDTS